MKKNGYKEEFLDFNEAREFIRNVNLAGWEDWRQYSKTKRPNIIPSQPWLVYKKEWKSIGDWLGNKLARRSAYNRKYSVNENFFKEWSYDMSYILGFWFADGCIYKSTFLLSQHKNDKYILRNISKVMEYDHKLVKRCDSNVREIRIYSEKIVKDIKSLGGKEKKSLDVSFPNIPKEYFSDFVRGYFDGDGSVSVSKDGKRLYTSFTTASSKFAYGFFDSLKKNVGGLNGGVSEKKRDNGKYYNIWFSKNDAIRLRDFMYSSKSKLRLKRKYNLLYSVGKISIMKKGLFSHDEAKKFVRGLKIKNSAEWSIYSKSNKRPCFIPSTPTRSYKNKGWISWKDFLGYDKIRKKGE
jgi:hypothetical protein